MVRETYAVYLSDTTVKGQYVLRVCVDSPHANDDDMRTIYKVLSQQATILMDGRGLKEKTDVILVEKSGQKSGNPGETSQIPKSENLNPPGSDSLQRGPTGNTSHLNSSNISKDDLGLLVCPMD